MNKFDIYIWIDGINFDPDRFQAGIAANLGGEVRSRKRVEGQRIAEAGKYWRSEVLSPAEDCVEEELLKLILKFKAEIQRAKSLGADRVFAEIVGYMKDVDHLRGFYISKELSRLLSELDMDLDIDIVRMLKT